jgi:hypothetical protein
MCAGSWTPDPDRDSMEDGDPLASGSDDPPPPASAVGRRLAIVVAFVFIAVIVAFLVWFISTNRERIEGGSFFGRGDVPAAERAGQATTSG